MGELNDKFEKIGARVKVVVDRLAALRIDVRRDRHGEFFELRIGFCALLCWFKPPVSACLSTS